MDPEGSLSFSQQLLFICRHHLPHCLCCNITLTLTPRSSKLPLPFKSYTKIMYECFMFPMTVTRSIHIFILQISFSSFSSSKYVYYCKQSNTTNLICGNKMPTKCNRLFLLQILLPAQHVSGTIMPIIRNSRVLYKWLLPVVFGALVFKLSV